MSYSFYKVLHVASVVLVLISLSGMIVHVWNGGTKENLKIKKILSILHGVGLLLSLVAGFGLLASLGMMPTPTWAWVKIAIWAYFGGVTAILFRMPQYAGWLYLKSFLLFVIASYLAVNKPF